MKTSQTNQLDAAIYLKTADNVNDMVLWEKIDNWDFTRIGLLNQKQFGHTEELSDEMIDEYKKYMFLLNKYPSVGIPMSGLVDDVWHSHIISTHNYQAFCDTISGKYINHIPVVTDEEVKELADRYLNNTLSLMDKHFGINSKFWPNDASFACCETLAEGYGSK